MGEKKNILRLIKTKRRGENKNSFSETVKQMVGSSSPIIVKEMENHR
jgi:hypothetical protein